MPSDPVPPIRADPPGDWQHRHLYARVREAIGALPFYFRTETAIAGIMATDIFTLNATLGATIEDQVVRTLNDMRPIWDPDDQYRLYGFVRQPQTFPDVLLRHRGPSPTTDAVILGLELKGWYLLAKEGEPSFRFTVTPAACSPQDLIVVVPRSLSPIISGSPRVFAPYLESARYAAEYRNYHWQHRRHTQLDTGIRVPENIQPYPRKSDQTADQPAQDPGGNFGRFARTGIMDDYINSAKSLLLAGIEARHWLAFFRAFQEQGTVEDVERALAKLAGQIAGRQGTGDLVAQSVGAILAELERLLRVE